MAQSENRGSIELIEQGMKTFDTGNYKQAIKFYAQVPEGDTNFLLAQYEMGLAYNADSQYAQARNLALRALDHPEAETRLFQFLLGNSYDYLGKQDSAKQCYNYLLSRNPNDYQVYYELGILHLRKEAVDSAISYLEKALTINPYHFRSMKVLGSCYGLQGRLTESWTCMQNSLLIANNYSMAQAPIAYLDGIVKQTDEFSQAYQSKAEKYQHPLYDKIDAILNARLVLDEEYKIKSVLSEESQAKAIYAIIEKLQYDPKDNNFVMQYFVPLLLELKDKQLIDPYLLHLYSGYEIEKIEKLAAKEKSSIAKTRELCNDYLRLITATRTLNFEERKNAPLKYQAITSESLFISSNLKTLDVRGEGPAQIYKNGTLIASGKFNKNGKKDGTWTYYYLNGQVKTIENLKDGELVGEEQKFYKSGILKSKARYNSDHKTEYEIGFSRNGEYDEEYELQKDNSIRNTTFYPNGKKRFSVVLVKDVYKDGTYEGYFENGKVSKELTIKDGKLNGVYKEFYEEGNVNAVYYYNSGKIEGEYKLFHKNGKPFVVTQYKDDELEGLYEKWNEEGLYLNKQWYKNGKIDGKRIYFDEGKEYGYVTYKEGLPVDYEFKDLKGNLVASDKGPLKVLRIYFSNGNLQAEFPLEDGVVNGTAKFYTYGGSLREETEYVKGLKEGSEKTYFKNGKISYEAFNKADEKSGYYKGFSSNGRLITEGWLDKDRKQGIWKYNHINGMPTTRCFYQNNEISGFNEDYNIKGELTVKDLYTENVNFRTIQFDSNGKEFNRIDFDKGNGVYLLKFQGSGNTRFECKQVNGLLEGPFKKYYPDGTILEEGLYKNGQRNGRYSFYNFIGQKSIIGEYKEGKKSGVWVYFESNNDTSAIMNYEEDLLEGKKYSFEKGVLNYASNYINDLREGPQYIYDDQKKLAVVMNFSEGILMSYTYEDKDGKLLPPIEVKNGTAAVRAYYSNGNKSIEFDYLESSFNGVQKFYYSNGVLGEERNYNYGEVNGDWKEYHSNGKLKLVCTYKDNEYHGPYVVYDENGEKTASYNYYNGELHGTCELLDYKTKTLQKMLFRYGYPVKRQ